jgi:SAM-dependent methyltransferase
MDFKDYASGIDSNHFWFKAKSNLIEILLKKAGAFSANIVNVGAGTGEDLPAMKRFGYVFAIDIDQNALSMIPSNLVAEKKLGSGCNIPYENNKFDIAVSFDVLEHVEQDEKMASEILRVLKPGGYFVFTVPAFNFLYSRHDDRLQHYRRYNKKNIRKLLKNFEEKESGYWFFSLFVPAVLARTINPSHQGTKTRGTINSIFYSILNFENKLIAKNLKFPFGLTLYGIFKKPVS